MTKKLISLLGFLMAVSMICTGYSSWVIVLSTSDTQTVENNSFVSYEVDDLRLSAHGLGLSATNAKSFTYCTVTAGGGDPVVEFTNTTLAIQVKVNPSLMKNFADYRDKTLIIECVAKNSTKAVSFEATPGSGYNGVDSNNTGNGLGRFLTPTSCKLTLEGYPNLSMSASVAMTDVMQVSIPLEQLYNLAVLDKASLNNSTLTLEIPFSIINNAMHTNAVRQSICSLTYSFTAKLVKN